MSSLSSWMAAVIVSAACAGCTVRARTQPVGYAELYYGREYAYYPHTVYDGRDVYYVGNRWAYRDGSGWGYYESEPPALYRYRTTIRQAPPAPRYYDNAPRVYQPAQPVPGTTPAPGESPPPTRVR
jgi:hypothetical protein